MRLIDADALKDEMSKVFFNDNDDMRRLEKLIDNAPTVEYPFYQEAYQTGYEEGKNERTQGEWFDFIDNRILKARHGDYVLYKVDFLLDNLTREVYIMEGARRMRGKEE